MTSRDPSSELHAHAHARVHVHVQYHIDFPERHAYDSVFNTVLTKFGRPPSRKRGKRAGMLALARAGPFGVSSRSTPPHVLSDTPSYLRARGKVVYRSSILREVEVMQRTGL